MLSCRLTESTEEFESLKCVYPHFLEDSVIYFRLMHNLKTVSSKTLFWVFSCPQETKLRNQVSFTGPRNNHPSWHLTPRRHRKWDLFTGSVVSSREQREEMMLLINSSVTRMFLLRKRVQDTISVFTRLLKIKGFSQWFGFPKEQWKQFLKEPFFP